MNVLNVVVGGIAYKDKLLLIKRKRGDYQQKWALVGGKMNFDEEIKDALLREIKEETGLLVKWKGVKAILNEKLKSRETLTTYKQFFIILCMTESDSDILKETAEGELRWFSQKDIEKEKKNIIPSDFLMINELLKRKNLSSIIELELLEKNNDLEIRKNIEY